MPSPKLNTDLNKVLALYENDKDHFPLHRFFTRITNPLLRELLRAYLKKCGFLHVNSLNKPGKAEDFLKKLHADVERCGLKRFITKTELALANVYTIMSNTIRSQRALSLVYLVAMQHKLPKKFSNDALVKRGMEIGVDPVYRNRVNLYAILNKILESDKMVKRGDFYNLMTSGRGSSNMKLFERIIDNDQGRGNDSLLVIYETERKYLVGIKGKEYAELPTPYKIRHAAPEDGPQMKKLIKKALIAEGMTSVNPTKYFKSFFLKHPNEFVICEFNGRIVGFRQIIFGRGVVEFKVQFEEGLFKNTYDGVSCSGLVYITKGHTGKGLLHPLEYFLVKSLIELKGEDETIYARPVTEIGETLLIKIGYKFIGYDTDPGRPYYDAAKEPPMYSIKAGTLLKNTEKKLKEIKVPYEFC